MTKRNPVRFRKIKLRKTFDGNFYVSAKSSKDAYRKGYYKIKKRYSNKVKISMKKPKKGKMGFYIINYVVSRQKE